MRNTSKPTNWCSRARSGARPATPRDRRSRQAQRCPGTAPIRRQSHRAPRPRAHCGHPNSAPRRGRHQSRPRLGHAKQPVHIAPRNAPIGRHPTIGGPIAEPQHRPRRTHTRRLTHMHLIPANRASPCAKPPTEPAATAIRAAPPSEAVPTTGRTHARAVPAPTADRPARLTDAGEPSEHTGHLAQRFVARHHRLDIEQPEARAPCAVGPRSRWGR